MITDQQADEFNEYWLNPKQEELRNSCAKGWALQIWLASREAIEIEISGYDSLLRALYDGVDINGVVEAIKAQGLKVKVTP